MKGGATAARDSEEIKKRATTSVPACAAPTLPVDAMPVARSKRTFHRASPAALPKGRGALRGIGEVWLPPVAGGAHAPASCSGTPEHHGSEPCRRAGRRRLPAARSRRGLANAISRSRRQWRTQQRRAGPAGQRQRARLLKTRSGRVHPPFTARRRSAAAPPRARPTRPRCARRPAPTHRTGSPPRHRATPPPPARLVSAGSRSSCPPGPGRRP
jgi:hypothetical protein